MENRAGEKRNAGSFAWLESKEADKSVFSPPFFSSREGVWQTTHTAGKPQEKEERKRGEQRAEQRTAEGKGTRMERFEEEGKKSVSHLVVDIKHSLLDLLIDLLGCVDESLR